MSNHDDRVLGELRGSLRRQADGLPYAPDMAAPAIGRARAIRRRRRTVAGAAALALVAVAVPVGLRVADEATRTAPAPPATQPTPSGETKLSLDLDNLPAGARPSVPFAQNGVFFLAGGNGATDFQSLDWYGVVAWGEVAAVTTAFDDGTGPRLYVYDNSSQQAQDVLVEEGAESTVASADNRWLAYVDAGEDGAEGTLTVADAEPPGRTDTIDLDGQSAELLAVVDGTVFFQAGGGTPELTSWSAADGFRSFDPEVSMVSADGSLVGAVTERTDFGNCYELVELATSEVHWNSCDWMPRAVSPDGRWVYATPAYADGYGPTRVAVLDAETGQLVREVRLDSNERYIGVVRDATWESDDTLLLQVESAGEAALVRLNVVTGAAELATEPVPYAGLEDPQPPPYLLGG